MHDQSLKTEESYVNAGKLLIKFFGDKDICLLTFDDARDWKLWLAGWQSPDTVRGNIICLRMVLKFLRKRHYSVLDYEEIPVAKREKRTIKFLDEEEMADFILEVGRRRRGYPEVNRLRNVAIVTLLYETGIRNGELCALNRDSIKNRTFTIIGKSADPRIGFHHEQAEDAIKAYLEKRTDNDKALFISNQTGKRITSGTLRRIFENVCHRSDFEDIHPHTIRHSYATKLIMHEVDILYVGTLLGHKDLNTTKGYTHYVNPHLKRIYDQAHAET